MVGKSYIEAVMPELARAIATSLQSQMAALTEVLAPIAKQPTEAVATPPMIEAATAISERFVAGVIEALPALSFPPPSPALVETLTQVSARPLLPDVEFGEHLAEIGRRASPTAAASRPAG
jgi:hypothetical protein